MGFSALILVCSLQTFNFNFVFNVYSFSYLYWVVICIKFFFFLIFDDCAKFLFYRVDILAIVLYFLFHYCKSSSVYLKIYWVCD